MKKYIIIIIMLLANNFFGNCQALSKNPNILFIAVDDMADWAGYLDHPDAITPNIDRLAHQGIAFTAAQSTSPICGPSRTAVVTFMQPETTQIYSNVGNYSDYVPDAISIPEYFKQNSYYTMEHGKLLKRILGIFYCLV